MSVGNYYLARGELPLPPFPMFNIPTIMYHVSYLHDDHLEIQLVVVVVKLIDIVKLRSACIMYKAHKKLLPNNLQLLISLDSDRSHITRQSNTFKQAFARTTLKSRCISVQGIKLWNSLENSIKSAENIFMFRKLYKRRIFQLYRT